MPEGTICLAPTVPTVRGPVLAVLSLAVLLLTSLLPDLAAASTGVLSAHLQQTVKAAPAAAAPLLQARGFARGSAYLAVALGMNAWFIWSAVRVLRERSDRAARRMFRISLVYLFSLFLAMNVELIVFG